MAGFPLSGYWLLHHTRLPADLPCGEGRYSSDSSRGFEHGQRSHQPFSTTKARAFDRLKALRLLALLWPNGLPALRKHGTHLYLTGVRSKPSKKRPQGIIRHCLAEMRSRGRWLAGPQVGRFIETARAIGCHEDKERFEAGAQKSC
jgi:hypothetical protein